MKFGVVTVALTSIATLVSAADSRTPYVPVNASCPSGPLVRVARNLSDGETAWLQKRQQVVKPAFIDWLQNSGLEDFDASQYFSNTSVPVIGVAFSGGGYRAMLSGAGELAGLDNRTNGSTRSGHLGGLLQATTYMAGLSGGNWLVGSVAMNNFSSVQDLQASKDLWSIEDSIVEPGGINVFKTFGYWDTIIDDVEAKGDYFNTSLTDLWGRGLGYQLLNSSKGGQSLAYSEMRDYDVFTNAEMPFPLHVTDRRGLGQSIVSLNSSVFEYNPFELGSWDPNVYSFADLKYLGSEVNNGEPTGDQCVVGYDNAGYMIGTSATLFNQFLLRLNTTGITGEIRRLAQRILTNLGNRGDDIAIFDPNPFAGVEYASVENDPYLTLVDGGEDNENVPLYPLIQPERNVQAVFAFDNSADTQQSWPDGSSLVNTYRRQFGDQANGTIFPYVPDNKTFLNGGLTEQPVFFGCSRDNLTSLFNSQSRSTGSSNATGFYPPVIIYIANSQHSYASNESTFKLSYETKELGGMIENGYNIVTQNNGTLDSEWRTCVACALILREQQSRGESPTSQCQQCFDRYCWDGSIVENGNGAHRRDNKSNIVRSPSTSSSSTRGGKNAAPGMLTPSVMGLAAAVGALFVL